MAIRLTTFAEPRLADESGNPYPLPAKAILALVYMASRGLHRIPRLELAEFLWDPEKTDTSANLRQLLVRTKSRLIFSGQPLLQSESGDVVAALDGIEFDFKEIPWDVEGTEEDVLRRHVDIQKGVFLAGIDISSERSGQWLSMQRDRYVSSFARALEAIHPKGIAGPSQELIIEAGVRLLDLDAYCEVAVRTLMQSYATTGKHIQAQILFRKHSERLKSELGTRPDPQTRALAESLYPDLRQAPASIRVIDSIAPISSQEVEKGILPRVILLPPPNAVGERGRLATALIEDIAVGLCRARSMSLVAHHTAARIAASPDLRTDAFTRHNVSYAFETRLRDEGDQLVLFGTLSHIAQDRCVWAEKFNVSPGKLGDSYKEIVRVLVSTLTRRIEDNELHQIGSHEPTVYQSYLLGQHYLRTIRLQELRRARKLFKNSINREPSFAQALGGLARAEHLEWLVTARGDQELLKSAERHAEEAIGADSMHPSGYHQLGVVRLYNGAFDESVAALEQAVGIAPSYADLIADYADTLVHASEPQRALETIERAIELNPLCPDVYWWTAAGANYCLERFDTALDCIGKMADKSTTGRLAGACWGMLGETKKARSFMRSTMKTYPDFSIEKWLSIMPIKENWQKDQYRDGLRRAGFQ